MSGQPEKKPRPLWPLIVALVVAGLAVVASWPNLMRAAINGIFWFVLLYILLSLIAKGLAAGKK